VEIKIGQIMKHKNCKIYICLLGKTTRVSPINRNLLWTDYKVLCFYTASDVNKKQTRIAKTTTMAAEYVWANFNSI
jgi:hypothetical protein